MDIACRGAVLPYGFFIWLFLGFLRRMWFPLAALALTLIGFLLIATQVHFSPNTFCSSSSRRIFCLSGSVCYVRYRVLRFSKKGSIERLFCCFADGYLCCAAKYSGWVAAFSYGLCSWCFGHRRNGNT